MNIRKKENPIIPTPLQYPSMADQSMPKILQPCSKQIPTKYPLLSDIFIQKNLKKWPIKINFPGCRKPHQNWFNWVEKLALKYAKIWELTGICDGILSSLHEIKLNPEIVLALSEFWCSKTNTFIFPWGEATVTLEDINVLFGLPVLGENVDYSLDEGLSKKLEHRLQQVKTAISNCSCELDAWINYFNVENDDVEHVGFLAFWLSMFVFPDLNDRTIGNHVFSIAVSLAQGMKIALAPAVLACLYQNLTFITQNAADFDSAKTEVSVPAPFQIVQLWALERFPCLGSNLAKPLSLGYPRIARWDSVCFKANLVGVRRAIRSSSDSFCWRPYALNLENSRQKSFHIDSDKISSSDLSGDVDEEMKSFYVFLQPQELIGIDCTATYQPQRVMMQFGCDQEVPNHNKLSKVLTNDDENAIIEGFQQETSDEGDLKKPILTSETMKTLLNRDDEAVVSPESEVLNVSDDDNGTKQIICGRNEERSKEDMVVILDSDDEKVGCKDVSLSRSKKKRLKRRIGDSADYPLFINEYSRKVVKKSGVSSGNAIDVENY